MSNEINRKRKCCLERDKYQKLMKANLENFELGSKFFEFLRQLIDFYESILHQWRNRNSSDITNCPNCSQFTDELPISLLITGKINFSFPQQEFKK